MQNISKLLSDIHFNVGTIREARNRFASQLAPDFNIFDFLRTDEMGISTCIAELLKPRGSHGQGDVFLRLFLDMLELPDEWPDKIEPCKVVTERSTNNARRIDIVAEFSNAIIGIENKPWAGDQLNQLADYADYLANKTGKEYWFLVYLSNREPSSESITHDRKEELARSNYYQRLSYDQLNHWLTECAKEAKAISVKVFIEEMIKFVRTKINGELDMSEQAEVKKLLLSNPENLQSAFDVVKSINGIKAELLEKLHRDLHKLLEEKGYHLSWGKHIAPETKSYVGFGIKVNPEQKKYLRFEFDAPDLNHFFWGIARINAIKKTPPTWSLINAVMQDAYYSGSSADWWPWWSFQFPEEFGESIKNWKTDARPWQMIQDGTLAPVIVKLAEQVYQRFDDDQFKTLLMSE